MKKIDLGQSITMLANIGVIAGIVFLAVELQQNNELLRVEVELSRNAGIAEPFIGCPLYTSDAADQAKS